MRRDRRAIRAPDMTSLFDVLFILVFVSLVNVGVNHTAAEEAEARAKTAEDALASASVSASAAPSVAPSVSARPSASAAPSAAPSVAPPVDLSARSATLIVRVDAQGVLRAIERDGVVTPVDEPLLAKIDDPDVVYEYRGDRSREHRICAIVVEKLGLEELSHFIVVITTPESDAKTNLILGRGINNDRLRCADEQKGFAVLAPGSARIPGDSP